MLLLFDKPTRSFQQISTVCRICPLAFSRHLGTLPQFMCQSKIWKDLFHFDKDWYEIRIFLTDILLLCGYLHLRRSLLCFDLLLCLL